MMSFEMWLAKPSVKIKMPFAHRYPMLPQFVTISHFLPARCLNSASATSKLASSGAELRTPPSQVARPTASPPSLPFDHRQLAVSPQPHQRPSGRPAHLTCASSRRPTIHPPTAPVAAAGPRRSRAHHQTALARIAIRGKRPSGHLERACTPPTVLTSWHPAHPSCASSSRRPTIHPPTAPMAVAGSRRSHAHHHMTPTTLDLCESVPRDTTRLCVGSLQSISLSLHPHSCEHHTTPTILGLCLSRAPAHLEDVCGVAVMDTRA